MLILTLVLLGSVEEQRSNYLKALECLKLAQWIECYFLRGPGAMELKVLLASSLSRLQERYGHYILEQRDIENVLKRVVDVVLPAVEVMEPRLAPRDESQRTNETLYARFKVEELNRSLFLYHGQHQNSPPTSQRKPTAVNAISTGKKVNETDLPAGISAVEETTAMVTPKQSMIFTSRKFANPVPLY